MIHTHKITSDNPPVLGIATIAIITKTAQTMPEAMSPMFLVTIGELGASVQKECH